MSTPTDASAILASASGALQLLWTRGFAWTARLGVFAPGAAASAQEDVAPTETDGRRMRARVRAAREGELLALRDEVNRLLAANRRER